MNIDKDIVESEIIAVMITGCVPVLIAYGYGGVDYLAEILKSILVHKFLMFYTLVLVGMFVVFGFLDHHFNFVNAFVERRINSITRGLHEAVNSLIGILRVSGGVLITIFFILLSADYRPEYVSLLTLTLFLGFMALLECFIMQALNIRYAKKWAKL